MGWEGGGLCPVRDGGPFDNPEQVHCTNANFGAVMSLVPYWVCTATFAHNTPPTFAFAFENVTCPTADEGLEDRCVPAHIPLTSGNAGRAGCGQVTPRSRSPWVSTALGT